MVDYSAGALVRVVASIRTLEHLKGRERRDQLDRIYHHGDNQHLITAHCGSLSQLAAQHGIDQRVVSPKMYRDEADVLHDLNLLEREGTPIRHSSLCRGHARLNAAMRKNGWGLERIAAPPPRPPRCPRCNLDSGLMHDRMIVFRRTMELSQEAAASEAGIGRTSWAKIEAAQAPPSAAAIAKIEKLLADHPGPAPCPHSPVPKNADSSTRITQS